MAYPQLFTVSSDKVKALKIVTSLVEAYEYADHRADMFPNRTYYVDDYRGMRIYTARGSKW